MRWRNRVLPQVLQEMMRHARIETTFKYYASADAQKTADAVWDAYEATRTPSSPKAEKQPENASAKENGSLSQT
jgi:hypothetical protein